MRSPPGETDISNVFADLVGEARYEDLPTAAIESAKKSILDTLGVILAASGAEPRVRALVDLVQEAGGRAESTVLGFGGVRPQRRPPLPTEPWPTAWISMIARRGVRTQAARQCPPHLLWQNARAAFRGGK